MDGGGAPQVFLRLSCYYSYAKWPISGIFPSQVGGQTRKPFKSPVTETAKKTVEKSFPFFGNTSFQYQLGAFSCTRVNALSRCGTPFF